MPHLIIEKSTDIQISDDILLHLNRALLDTGHFQAIDIKSRIIHSEASLVGVGEKQNQGFIAVQLRIMSGRSEQVKQQFAQALLQVLQQYQFAHEPVQCSVEVIEISSSYQKSFIG